MPESAELSGAAADIERQVLDITRTLCCELDSRASDTIVGPCDSLQRDLGLDSLARAELMLRVERGLGARMAPGALAEADSVRDIVQRLRFTSSTGAPPTAAIALPGAPHEFPGSARTLIDVLRWHVERNGARTQLVFLSPAGEQALSYSQLDDGARSVAGWLQSRGVEPGQTVAIMLPTCIGYFHAYFGILLAGAVPVPIYPPARLQQIEEHVRRHAGILANANVALMISTQQAMPAAQLLRALVPPLRAVTTVDECLRSPLSLLHPVPRAAADTAFIQYTSGSTGSPKGVVLSHANLLANIRAMGQAIGVRDDDVFVSWLPLYHDMGLIAAWLSSLYHGRPLVVMSPLDFLGHPESWLWALHRWRGTLTAAPNFAYELCVRHINDTALQGLDLGSVRLMASGAEAVNPLTLERFATRFARYGLHEQALTPVYGLAECTVGLLVPPPGRGPRVDRINRSVFGRERRAIPTDESDAAPLRFVDCGRPLPGHDVRVVDDEGSELGERVEGHLQFRGPSATSGYLHNPALTRALIGPDGWLDSGDLAYRADGEYYLTGRIKDLIIRGGRHLYPDEIEQVVGEIAGVRKGRVVAFGVTDAHGGTESLVVVAETNESDAQRREDLRARISRALDASLGESADVVRLLRPGSVLKTSSGKLRRGATRELYLAGRLGASTQGPAWQIARLGATVLWQHVQRAWGAAGRVAWGARAWLAFGLLAPLLCGGALLLRDPARAWRFAHRIARGVLRAAGVRLQLRGVPPRLPEGAILVVNHASYADGLVLLAAFEQPLRFVAKAELRRKRWFARCLLGLGVVFVERIDAPRSIDDARRLADVARSGGNLCMFAEGTFRRAPGLLAFHLGAFSVAVQAGVAVTPMAIRGTRELLPDGIWWPRRSALDLVAGEPLQAPVGAADEFAAAARLMRSSREFVLRSLGEADAAHVVVPV